MKRCFVIMPFSESHPERTEQYWTNHFGYLKTIIEESIGDIQVTRSTVVRGNILKDILHDLITSDIVIADLTDSNPNVYYELGIRQSFRHGTITLAQEGTKLPFDIGQKGTLLYSTSQGPAGTKVFENRLLDAIKHCINKPDEKDSDILEYAFGNNSINKYINADSVHRKLNGLYIEFIMNIELIKKIPDTITSLEDLYFIVHLNFRKTGIELLLTEMYIDLEFEDIEKIIACLTNLNYFENILKTLSNVMIIDTLNVSDTELADLLNLDGVIRAANNTKIILLEFPKLMSNILTRNDIGYNLFKTYNPNWKKQQ